ncbi:MAG TPA: glycosyltransferase N-terminal domain-containing protein, partial [Fibrobacteraceae bacterium]|nr:glycosyltransferase N-terminal domain-containing protein [Fibrobacteraceae bacterium]
MFHVIRSLVYGLAWILSHVSAAEFRWLLQERIWGPWPNHGVLWMHGASMGECRALLLLASRFPSLSILLTTQTAATRRCLETMVPPHVHIRMAPLDHPRVLQRFFQTGLPRALILYENEIWPEWLQQCAQHSVPVALVSGRMSPRALRLWLWVGRSCWQKTFAPLQALWVQNRQEALRFAEFSSQTIQIGGDWKWLTSSERANFSPDAQWDKRPIDLTIVSLHRSEFKCIREGLSKMLEMGGVCVLIPRYPQDSNWFEQKLYEAHCPYCTWPQRENGCVSLVKELGKVQSILLQSRLALVGGSFTGCGVHNVREPLCSEVPVLVGPHWGSQGEEIRHLMARQVVACIQDLSLASMGRDGHDLWIPGWYPWERRH